MSFTFLYAASGVSTCIGAGILLYNLASLLLFMREETEGNSSGMAKAAWGIGLVALFVSGMPCVGLLVGLVAMGLAHFERNKIYRDESSLAGTTPVRMGSLNGTIAVFINVMMFGGVLASALMGGEAAAPQAP